MPLGVLCFDPRARRKGKTSDPVRKSGNGGFGYDPVFIVENAGKTMAEMTEEEKNAISHRGRALRNVIEFLTH